MSSLQQLGAFVKAHCPAESFADELIDAAGPYVEPSAADREWLARMDAREQAMEELHEAESRREWSAAWAEYARWSESLDASRGYED